MRIYTLSAMLAAVVLCGCGSGKSSSSTKAATKDGDGDAHAISAEERPFYDAGKPFYHAIGARDYAKAYAMLSSHAKASMMLFQFKPGENDRETAKSQAQKYENVSATQFSELMAHVEKNLGAPQSLGSLDVFSTDAAVLARKSKEQLGALDSMFAIGAMPDSIPADIRKASLRGQIHVELSDDDLAKVAKAQGVSVEELKSDPDFKPYLNLKTVLVEEGGALKVGYFEFMPPSMMD